MIYADSSALIKLVVAERESAALRSWFEARADEAVATSVVGDVELRRVAQRLGSDAPARVEELLGRVDRLTLTAQAVAVAGRIGPPNLRALDAFHVAAATLVPSLTALVTYDVRMIEAARSCGLPVVSPA